MFTKATLAEKSSKILDTFTTAITGLAEVNLEANAQIEKKETEAAALLTEVADLNQLTERNAKIMGRLEEIIA